MSVELTNMGRVSRTLPQGTPDNIDADFRLDRYGAQYVKSLIPTKHVLADEGTYFVATTPTPGTAVSYAVTTGFTDTVPFMYLGNTASPDDPLAKRINLDYIKLIVTVAPASAVQAYFAIVLDTITRFPTTNNMTALAATNPNTGYSRTSVMAAYSQTSATASAVPASGTSTKRVVARGAFGGLPIVGDELVMVFGAPDPGPYQGLTAAQATCPGRKVSNCPPIILAPNTNAVVHLWFPSNATTALSYELEMGWWER